MMELQQIATNNGTYTYNDKTWRNGRSQDSEFTKLFGGSFEEEAKPKTPSREESRYIQDVIFGPDMDVLTYDGIGKLQVLKRYSGLNIDCIA